MINQKGFSLIELVAGMTVLALAYSYMSAVMFKQFENSVDPLFKVRSAELGQAYMEEVIGKRFDEESGPSDRCGDGANPACTLASALGSEAGESRTTYDDVDDYHGLDTNTSGGPKDSLGVARPDFEKYRVQITVVYDNNYDGTSETNTDAKAKLIKITVTDPRSDQVHYAAYRGNY